MEQINPTRRNSSYLNEFPYIVDDKGHRKIDTDAEMYLPGSDTMGMNISTDQDPTMMPKKRVQRSLKTMTTTSKQTQSKEARDGKIELHDGVSLSKVKYYYKVETRRREKRLVRKHTPKRKSSRWL